MLQTISVEISQRAVATISLNRPDRGNSFDQRMLDELNEQLALLGKDEHVRLVLLRGSGRHFCTGADLSARAAQFPAGSANEGKPPSSLRDVLMAIETLPKPAIALVHGGAIGGGAAFVACCDIALATEAAFFSIPEVRVGMPPLGVMPFLVRAMGHRNFRRYGLSGERITAAEALRIGLVHQVCQPAAVDDTLARLTDDLLHGAPGAIATLKKAATEFAAPTLQAVQSYRPPHDARTPEAAEGVASFREKRKPKWYPQ
jgi:methylglutaconyl-CoA hydratase